MHRLFPTLAILFTLFPIWGCGYAVENDIGTARKSAEYQVETSCIRNWPEWHGAQIIFAKALTNSKNEELGTVFFVNKNGKVVGKVLVGDSRYSYRVIEVNTGNESTLDRDAAPFGSAIAPPLPYWISIWCTNDHTSFFELAVILIIMLILIVGIIVIFIIRRQTFPELV